jgi:glycosyltransferase involved in cell wall biosynthesis
VRPRVTFLVTYPRGIDLAREAVAQDIAGLLTRVDGRRIHISPPERLRRIFPERLFGLWLLPALRKIEAETDAYHLFHGGLRHFPLLGYLRRPIVYSVVAGLRPNRPVDARPIGALAALTVTGPRDAALARAWGATRVATLRPGVDLARFPRAAARPYSPGDPFRLVIASAPWSEIDFIRKGVDALLDAAGADERLRLVFLWRGRLLEQMRVRIAARGLAERVTIIDARVDMAAALADAHAAALLADDSSIVKAYPNSLMEALAVGRPVLVSTQIPLSDEVGKEGAGVVTPGATPEDARAGLSRLMANYGDYAGRAQALPRERYSRERWLDEMVALYERLT